MLLSFNFLSILLTCSALFLVSESYTFEKVNKTFEGVENDPLHVTQDPVSSGNLFGWLNLKHYVRFRLWTRKNPQKAQELKVQNMLLLNSSTFDPKRLTKIIIHGFSDSANEVHISDYLLQFRDTYLTFGDVNVIVVDYTFFALPLLYITSLHEVVAEKLTELLHFMVDEVGLKWNSVHLIGISWGAHVAGLSGHAVRGRIGRITGLDPAGPLFRFVDNEFRLDKSDAQFVDIIHVNGGTRILLGGHFGLKDALGHVDVYPNGGTTQNGCPKGRTFKFETLICSHVRAVSYFLESISSPLAFPMCECNDFDAFVKNECPCESHEISYMGEHISHKSRGIFQLITRSNFPYGHGPEMQVTLPDIDTSDVNTVKNKRSHGKIQEEEEKSEAQQTYNYNTTAHIIYQNKSRQFEFNNDFSSTNYPNDKVLQLCLLVKDEKESNPTAS